MNGKYKINNYTTVSSAIPIKNISLRLMFMTKRKVYLIAFFISIGIGLLSRKTNAIPLYTGDIIYAIMSYWMFRFLFYPKSLVFSLIASLSFCFLIELLQLIQNPFFIWLRSHQFLRLIFGQGFLWSDLIAYTIGVNLAYLIDFKFIMRQKNSL